MRRGPSELNDSTRLEALNGLGYGPGNCAGVAATPNELAALVAECPLISPCVGIERSPRIVLRCMNRPTPDHLMMTRRCPADPAETCSYGSAPPVCWSLVPAARTVKPSALSRNKS